VSARSCTLAVLCLAALIAGALLLLGGGDGYTVKAEFRDAGGVRKNSDVKIGEVPAGRVTGVKLTDRDTAVVTMKLDDGVGPLGAGARAASRPVNLLGEKFIDLDPGDLQHPVGSGTTIAAKRTDTAVELDDVLNALQPGTRARLRILLNEAGIALAGRGTDVNRLLEQMPGGLDESARLLAALSRDTRRLERAAVDGDRVLAAVSSRRADLGRLVESADDALAVTASRRVALNRALVAAPGGLGELRRALGELRRAGDDLRPAAANLRRTAAPLAGTLRRLPGFADDASQTLDAAVATGPALDRLGRQGTPTVRRLRPTAQRLGAFARELRPVSDELGASSMRNLLRFMNNWGAITQVSDGLSHIFRVRLNFGPGSFADKPPAPVARRRTRSAPAPRRAAPTAPRTSDPRPRTSGPQTSRPEIKLPKLPKLPEVRKLLGEAPQRIVDAVPELTKRLLAPGRDHRDEPQDSGRLLDYLLGN
jgi:phospholipid/cholesterol/gamma-HCH transport system substrate-binding protein